MFPCQFKQVERQPLGGLGRQRQADRGVVVAVEVVGDRVLPAVGLVAGYQIEEARPLLCSVINAEGLCPASRSP
jgi:hypothetical protein